MLYNNTYALTGKTRSVEKKSSGFGQVLSMTVHLRLTGRKGTTVILKSKAIC